MINSATRNQSGSQAVVLEGSELRGVKLHAMTSPVKNAVLELLKTGL